MKKNNYLTLGGLFVALHLLFVFISKILIGSEFILVVFLPLLSTIYTLKFGVKETIMFFIASFFLCAIFEPVATFIYVLPALICGITYGVLRKNKVKELSLVYVSSLSHSISLLIAFISISLMFKEVNFFNIFSNFIKKEGNEFYVCVYLILILLGLLEAFVTHIIASNELKKLGYNELEEDERTPLWMNVGLIISLSVYAILGFINPIYTCYCLPFLIAFSLPNIIEFIILNKHRWIYFMVGLLVIVSIFLVKYINAIFYPGLLLFIFSPIILENFGRVLYTISRKYLNNGKNNIE